MVNCEASEQEKNNNYIQVNHKKIIINIIERLIMSKLRVLK